MSLDKYFYKHRYRKEINESGMMGVSSSCDVDSIDDTADEGVIESEEIVIYHFQNIAEYTTIERDLTNSIKVCVKCICLFFKWYFQRNK